MHLYLALKHPMSNLLPFNYAYAYISFLFKSFIKDGITPLQYAARTGKVALVEHLVTKYNVDVNHRDKVPKMLTRGNAGELSSYGSLSSTC